MSANDQISPKTSTLKSVAFWEFNLLTFPYEPAWLLKTLKNAFSISRQKVSHIGLLAKMNHFYRDRSTFGEREYEIKGSKIVAKGNKNLTSNFEISLNLETLDPEYDKLWLRSPLFMPAIYLTVLGVGGSVLLFEFSDMEGLSLGVMFFMAIGLVGISGAVSVMKSIEVARFKNLSGIGVLDIFKAGDLKDEFEAFVEGLSHEIAKQRSANKPE